MAKGTDRPKSDKTKKKPKGTGKKPPAEKASEGGNAEAFTAT